MSVEGISVKMPYILEAIFTAMLQSANLIPKNIRS
jgi:hypothetical protein